MVNSWDSVPPGRRLRNRKVGRRHARLGRTARSQRGAEPDIVVHNARVFTTDQALPRAEAFAVKNGRFTAVGSSAECGTSRRRGPGHRRSAGDITPGFIDTHCHVSGVNELYAVDANVRRVRELLNNLRQKADKTPAGMWVTAVMFDDTKLDVPLTRQHLDEVSREIPSS